MPYTDLKHIHSTNEKNNISGILCDYIFTFFLWNNSFY